MKINYTTTGSVQPGGAGSIEKLNGGTVDRSTAGLESSFPDQIQLSELSRQMRLLSADSPERQARIEQLSAEVASGRYDVDPGLISASLIEESSLG